MLMYLDSFYKFGYSAVACSRVSNVQLVGCNLRGGRDGLYVCPVCCEPLHYVTFVILGRADQHFVASERFYSLAGAR